MLNLIFSTFLKTTGSQEPINTTKTTVSLNSGFVLFMFFIIGVVFFVLIIALLNMREKIQDLEKKIDENIQNPQNTDEEEPK